MVKSLLDNEATEVSLRDKSGRTPMFDSVLGVQSNRHNQLAVLRCFLNHPDVDINARDSRGETLLHKVAREDYVHAASVLLERPDLDVSTQESKDNFSPLHIATRQLSVGIVRLMLARKGVRVNDTDKYGNSPLHLLAKASALSFEGGDQAESSRVKKVIQIGKMFFSRKDIDVNVEGVNKNTPLHDAAMRGNYVVARELLSRPNIKTSAKNAADQTPLHLAAERNSTDVAKILLSRDDVDAGARDNFAKTPLHVAAEYNYWRREGPLVA